MEFLKKFNINIKDDNLLKTALTHSSYSNEHKGVENYERLEFLGDAVLELVSSEYFFRNTNYMEGDMTKHRASYVCEAALSTYAKKIELDKEIILGNGQLHNLNDTIIADVFEAVIGAIYLDLGFNTAKKYIEDIMVPYIKEDTNFNMDYKTMLQEYVQTDRKSLVYELVRETGRAHNKVFEVIVKVDNIIYGRGSGKSKKEAEQKAAFDAYSKSAR
ncbi:MAG: ribonuclease III [Bacilli bacterium]